MKKIITLLLLLSISFNISKAQILNDTNVRHQIQLGLEKMYSYDFKESTEIFQKIRTRYPTHPVSYTLMALQTELQYFPLKDYPAQQKVYLNYLIQSRNLAEAMLDKEEDDIEANFFELATLGYIAAYDADNQEFMKAVGVAKKAYSYLKKGLEWTEKQPEFLFSSGIYNYYRVEYPETHALIKPFMFFFADGNKKLGLQQLDLATRKTIFVKNEATFYAGYVYMKYEGTPTKALHYNTMLIEKFPDNLLYQMQRAEILTALNKFEEADDYVAKLQKQKGIMFQCAASIFKGIQLERQHKDDQAEAYLIKGVKMPYDERFTKDYHALAYLSLAKIERRKGNQDKAKEYVKKCLKIAEYKSTTAEAKAFLK